MMEPFYSRDGITLIHGDCLEILPTMEAGSFDAVVMDPPYGINYTTERGRGAIKGYASWAHKEIKNDSDTSCRDAVLEMVAGLPVACFGSWKVQKPKGVKMVLIWDKGPAFGMGDLSMPWKPSWEEIYILGKGWAGSRDEGVLRGHIVVSWESKGRLHQNEKPVSLCEQLIKKIPRRKILDPFAGSGTTGIAAWRLGRKCTLIEISEEYCEIAAKRIDAEISRGKLFKDDEPEPIEQATLEWKE